MRAGLVATAVAVLALLLLAPLGASAGRPRPTRAAGHFLLALDSPAQVPDPAATARRSSYVVLQSWETARASELKRLNPRLDVLVYQNLSAMAEGKGEDGHSSSGVNWAEANAAHPEWFLLEADDARIAEAQYPWLWLADVGDPGYQERWTENVLNLLRTGPWDGVFMDDTNTTVKYHVYPESRVAKYPTNAAYEGAVGSMLAYAGPRITAAGKLAIPNFGAWPEHPGVVRGWLPYVSGGMDQQFVKWSPVPGKYSIYPRWLIQLHEEIDTERMGKVFLAITHARAGDGRAVRYGWATALLGAGGHTDFLASSQNGHGNVWSPQFDAPIGRPTGPAKEVGGGLWLRRFTTGLVVVNPTGGALGLRFGGTYSGSGLKGARGASLPAHTALVLTRSGR
jgi:hypothetical protein